MISAPRRVLFALALIALIAGCSRHKVARGDIPVAPPSIGDAQGSSSTPPVTQLPIQKNGNDQAGGDVGAPHVLFDAKPLLVETGIASWYGPPYHNRRGSDGRIYDMNAMTAAHRTLPLGSVVRVTNLKTGHWAIVRITDRGPFIEGRILDLSLAAAKKTDVERAGLAKVRVEVLTSPAMIESGGRWAVQIGSFDQQESAAKLAEQISHKYSTAKVLSFSGPIGDWWVRVRVLHDDRGRAQEIVRDTRIDSGKIFLVRLD